MAEEKSFKASAKKLRSLRAEGKIYKSQVLTWSLSLAGLVIGLRCFQPFPLVENKMLLEYLWLEGWRKPAESLEITLLFIVQISLVTLVAGAMAGNIVLSFQVGLKFLPGLLAPRFDRLDLVQGFRRLLKGTCDSWRIILNLAVLTSVLTWTFRFLIPGLREFLVASGDGGLLVFSWSGSLLCSGILCLVALGFFELLIERQRFYIESSMSHQELRREHREDEGDPQIKSMRKAQHEMLATQELIARVRKSRCIVVDTHKA